MKTVLLAAVALATPITIAAAQTPKTPADYVMKAGAGDQYEIQSSRVVLETTTNPQLKQFAQRMIEHHTKSTADVTAAARQAGLTPKPPMLDAKGKADVAALRKASGTARDTLYVTQQKAAHQTALALHQGYAASGTATPLKAAAAKIVPVVQMHITTLQSM